MESKSVDTRSIYRELGATLSYNMRLGNGMEIEPAWLFPEPFSIHPACAGCPYGTLCDLFGTEIWWHWPEQDPARAKTIAADYEEEKDWFWEG